MSGVARLRTARSSVRVGCLLLAFLGGAVAHGEQCTFIARTGAKVSPRSGSCSLDNQSIKNGQEVCTHEGRPISQTTFREGEPQGPGFYTDYNDQKLEVRWKGAVVDGPVKVFDRTGALECTMTVVNGKTEGVVRELWPGGMLKRATLFKGGEASGPKLGLVENGKVFELTCGESSFTPEDRKLCGFESGVSTVQFVQPDGRPRAYLARYRGGQLLEEETVDEQGRPMVRRHAGDRVDVTRRFENGKTYRSYTTVKGDYDGDFKEWNVEGQRVEESKYAKGRVASRTRYYLNGKTRQELSVDPKSGVITAKEFYDTGTPKKTGTYQPCRNERCLDWPTPEGRCASSRRTAGWSGRASTPAGSWTAFGGCFTGTGSRRARRPTPRGRSEGCAAGRATGRFSSRRSTSRTVAEGQRTGAIERPARAALSTRDLSTG